MSYHNTTIVEISSPLRGEVGANAPGGGDFIIDNTPTLVLPSTGRGKKPFTKTAQRRAKNLRNNLTEAEKKLWYFLRNNQLGVKFRRQQPIGKYIVDFICFDKSLIIELDGGQHGSNQSYDIVRDDFLKRENFTVLRFWNNEIMENMDGVLEVIVKHLAHPLLTSPLQGEETVKEVV